MKVIDDTYTENNDKAQLLGEVKSKIKAIEHFWNCFLESDAMLRLKDLNDLQEKWEDISRSMASLREDLEISENN